jgi:hypothetical protein
MSRHFDDSGESPDPEGAQKPDPSSGPAGATRMPQRLQTTTLVPDE